MTAAPKLNVPAAVAAPKKNEAAAPAPKNKNAPTAAAATTAVAASGAKYDKDGPSAASLMYDDCIKTPAEFVRVFKSADVGARSRCVSPDLIGFLAKGADAGTAIPDNRRKSVFWFWSGHDGLEKYLRMGFPQSVGDWTVAPDDPTFPGLQKFSNGQSLLTQIGYPAAYASVAKTYSLNIASAAAVRRALQSQRFGSNPFSFVASIGPISPTWTKSVAAYNEALGPCCGVRIPRAVAPVLDATTFGELSGCVPQCTYEALGFPSQAAPNPVVIGTRDANGQCVPPAEGAGALVNPTYFVDDAGKDDPASAGCNQRWRELCNAFATIYVNGCTSDAVGAAGKLLAQELDASPNVEDQAVIFRAYSAQACSGDFNPINAGNGFTATGFGGLFTPTSTEFITSPITFASLPSYAKETVFLCINGQNGGQPVDGKCSA
jgi:hypothetical protein